MKISYNRLHIYKRLLFVVIAIMKSVALKQQVSSSILQKIQKYSHRTLTNNFIIERMKQLSASNNEHLEYWRMLIRCTKNIQIQMNEHQLYGFNFAQFLENNLKYRHVGALKYFQQFCLNAIKNNPKLIANRYYVGNGGFPALQLMTVYLIRRWYNGSILQKYEQIQQPIFNLVKYIFENNLHEQASIRYYRYSLEFYDATTPKAAQVMIYILQAVYKQFLVLTKQQKQDVIAGGKINYQLQWFRDTIQRFFTSLFQFRITNKYRSYYWSYLQNEYYQNQMFTQTKMMKLKVINILQQKFVSLISHFEKIIAKSLLVSSSKNQLLLILELSHLPAFIPILFSQDFIFGVFAKRDRKLCQLLWAYQDQRERISMIRKNGKSLLEHVCSLRGLTHNLIGMLWQSELFGDVMPIIANKKSQKIIKSKYGI